MKNRKSVPELLIELKPSLIDKEGVGVFAVVGLRRGQKVAEGVSLKDFGHQVAWGNIKHLNKAIKKKIRGFCVGTPEGFIAPDEMNFNKLSIEWYFNHSCNGNLGFDKKGNFIAMRNIKKGEELSYDYGLIESNPKFKMRCGCQATNCRIIITGNDWKLLMRDNNKKKYMHPFLVRASTLER